MLGNSTLEQNIEGFCFHFMKPGKPIGIIVDKPAIFSILTNWNGVTIIYVLKYLSI